MSSIICRLCNYKKVETLINFGSHPIVNLLTKKKNYEVKKYPFELVICKRCNFQQIKKNINPNVLYQNYFNFSSEKNQPHVERFVNILESLSNCNKKTNFLEIGCNDGQLLNILKKKGYKKLTGVEPTKDTYKIAIKKHKVFNDFFSDNLIKKKFKSKKFDIVISRHVLEHIPLINTFLKNIKKVLKANGLLALEVPDHEYYLENLDYGLWEEHCNYFTLSTLESLLIKNNLSIIHCEKTLFAGRSMTVFVQVARGKIKKKYFDIKSKIQNYKNKFKEFKQKINELTSNKKVAIYGCGNRSANFVNFLKVKNIDFFIDDQKKKYGKFVPGNNLLIKKYNKKLKFDILLLGVNTENENKVIKKISQKCKIFSILPPSKNLPNFWKKLINS